mmetsp:Transcript_13132/g.20405  ORF Transcript_13132/g.20405 Transcript_13132/m.20405 type:complete len:107 (+) Transcript_13132:832-1152(+)
MPPPRNSIKKFKNIPFVWENENYLLKMKSDTSVWLQSSHLSRYFNYSKKNDPFLVYPSMKVSSQGQGLPQGSGATGIKKLRAGSHSRSQVGKMQVPLQNQLMKIIR